MVRGRSRCESTPRSDERQELVAPALAGLSLSRNAEDETNGDKGAARALVEGTGAGFREAPGDNFFYPNTCTFSRRSVIAVQRVQAGLANFAQQGSVRYVDGSSGASVWRKLQRHRSRPVRRRRSLAAWVRCVNILGPQKNESLHRVVKT